MINISGLYDIPYSNETKNKLIIELTKKYGKPIKEKKFDWISNKEAYKKVQI